ncbi:MAG: zinc metalloprotease, partial [Phycisphaerales bacterium]|nr:zinc metalloprotease [Phycisphaerales bacterium]
MLTAFFAAALAGAATPAATAPAADINVVHASTFVGADHDMQIISDTEIIIDGHTYTSWDAVAASGYYNLRDTRCGIDEAMLEVFDDTVAPAGNGADCSFSTTNPRAVYDPSVEKYRIPVVVHVIERTNGTGAMSDERVQSQIDILNEDFLALPGTNGAPGTDTQIEFYLATEDPNGNPTTGITRSVNNTWFNDGGNYWTSLAWDTDKYLNIYSNSASGALGYVPDLPQGGIAGSNSDRVVILYSTFGRNAPFVPFNLGRTGTHEVGHYLGLYHTFNGGCAGGNCYTRGDRICDTNDEQTPTGGCPGNRVSCGDIAPFRNYMDYSDDRCMSEFTPEQANRM